MKTLNRNIDDWFLGYKTRIVRKKSSGGFFFGSSSGSGKKPIRPGAGLRNIQAVALKHPEVMVKIPRRNRVSNGLQGVRKHLDYISRNGKLTLENQDGELLTGKSAIKALADEYARMGIPEHSRYREALNVVLSMPPGTDSVGLKNAAREFAKEQFEGHHWTMVQHLDTKHPHVHICVLMRDEHGRRMNPRKNDLHEWRVRFADKLRDEGIMCAATRRPHRGKARKAENGIVRHIKDSGREPYRHKQQAQALLEALEGNQRPSHPFLKQTMATRGIIIEEYGHIAKELYKLGHKTEARAVSQLAKEVREAGFETHAQQTYGISAQQKEPHAYTLDNNFDNLER